MGAGERQPCALGSGRGDDARDFGRYNGVFKEYFPDGRLARSTVEARAVITTKIEIEVVAYKPL